mmetsp:Transcript_15732/g.61442  ORF Transcript_15732/g.61442 Transcript_15732/m.61442 type:complete len:353 (+) Transcript_15732:1121-2179(+)
MRGSTSLYSRRVTRDSSFSPSTPLSLLRCGCCPPTGPLTLSSWSRGASMTLSMAWRRMETTSSSSPTLTTLTTPASSSALCQSLSSLLSYLPPPRLRSLKVAATSGSRNSSPMTRRSASRISCPSGTSLLCPSARQASRSSRSLLPLSWERYRRQRTRTSWQRQRRPTTATRRTTTSTTRTLCATSTRPSSRLAQSSPTTWQRRSVPSSRSNPCLETTTEPSTAWSASTPLPRTRLRFPSPSSCARTLPSTALLLASFMDMAATRWLTMPTSTRPTSRSWTGASSWPLPTCVAAARWEGTGTRMASSRRRKTPSLTSYPAWTTSLPRSTPSLSALPSMVPAPAASSSVPCST